MKNPRSGGFVTLGVMLLMVFVLGLLLAGVVGRSRQVALHAQRTIAQTQVKWMAHSAAEQALVIIQGGLVPTPLEYESDAWVSPAYGDVDPLAQWDIHPEDFRPHAVPVMFGYTIEAVDETRYRILAHAHIEYRSIELEHKQTYRCEQTQSGIWSLLPIADG